ncbi:hypothetical protein ABZ647_17765 [Micromonospora aurantiaca]|uniref:hypothetical protein n=1 Tax=Micromonospora aurantiaca (nom. illeg.) TaxID=47850 RepID=UPI0033F98F96
MIIATKNGHYDGDLCCGECGSRGPWQPGDKDPCTDDWWCRNCREWSEPDACGKNPLVWLMRNERGETVLDPACRRTGGLAWVA